MSDYELSDEVLIKKFQNGDISAYNQLVYRYKDRLLNFIYRFLNDIDRSEDLVQEMYIKIQLKLMLATLAPQLVLLQEALI